MPKYAIVEEAARHCFNKNFMGEKHCIILMAVTQLTFDLVLLVLL